MKYIYFCFIFALTSFSAALISAETIQDSKLAYASTLETEGQRLQKIQDRLGIEFAHIEFDQNFNQITSSMKEAFYQQVRFTPIEQITKMLGDMKNQTTLDEKTHSILENRSLSPQEKLYELSLGKFVETSKANSQVIQSRAEEVGYEKTFQELASVFRSRMSDSLFPLYGSGNMYYLIYFVLVTYSLVEPYITSNGNYTYDINFNTAGIGLGFSINALYFNYDGNGPIEGTYWGFQIVTSALLSLSFGFYLNENGRIITLGAGGGLGAGISFTKLTISNRSPHLSPQPDLNDEKYKVRPVPIERD